MEAGPLGSSGKDRRQRRNQANTYQSRRGTSSLLAGEEIQQTGTQPAAQGDVGEWRVKRMSKPVASQGPANPAFRNRPEQSFQVFRRLVQNPQALNPTNRACEVPRPPQRRDGFSNPLVRPIA